MTRFSQGPLGGLGRENDSRQKNQMMITHRSRYVASSKWPASAFAKLVISEYSIAATKRSFVSIILTGSRLLAISLFVHTLPQSRLFGPGTILLRLARGNGGGGSFLRAGGAFVWRHGLKGTLPADLSADFTALRALLAEEFQDIGRQLLFRHDTNLKPGLSTTAISHLL